MRTHSPFVGALYFSKAALKFFQNLPMKLPSKPDMPWFPARPVRKDACAVPWE
jgi:hypothetical protein